MARKALGVVVTLFEYAGVAAVDGSKHTVGFRKLEWAR